MNGNCEGAERLERLALWVDAPNQGGRAWPPASVAHRDIEGGERISQCPAECRRETRGAFRERYRQLDE